MTSGRQSMKRPVRVGAGDRGRENDIAYGRGSVLIVKGSCELCHRIGVIK
jgi:hypothetical protein